MSGMAAFTNYYSLQLLHQEDVKCTFFAPGGWRLCTTTLHFLGKFFVDFNRITFISSCFRGGMKRTKTEGYALALTGSGPSFMFPLACEQALGSFWGKNSEGKGKGVGGGGGEPVDRLLRRLFRRLVIILPTICQ